MRRFQSLLCALLVLYPVLVCPVRARAGSGPGEPLAREGVLDLRNQDLRTTPVNLDGEWGLYWHQLLSPGDPALKQKPDYVPFPYRWDQTILHGKALPSRGYATYTLTILLPPRDKRFPMAMDVPDVYCAYRLFLNGRILCSSGKPDTSATTSEPHWLSKTQALPEGEDTLRLVLQIANFWHAKGGPYKHLRVGAKRILYLDRQRTLSVDFLLAGCLLMGGLFFMGLYLFGRHDKAIQFFALFCILYSYRVVGTQYYALHDIFPEWNWFVTIRLEYLSLYLAVACLVQYVRYLYPEDIHLVMVRSMRWFCLLAAAFTVVTQPSVFTHIMTPFLFVMFFYVAYTLYVYVQAARQKRIGSFFALLSMGVLLGTFTVLNVEYLGSMERIQWVEFFGYLSFIFLQSLILSHRFSYDLKKSKMQAEEGSRAKSEFLSAMSHEIRTPLNSVIGMTHLLLMNEDRKEQKEQLKVLLFSANNLLSIVNDILDYHKIEAGKVDFESIPINLPEVAENIVAGFQSFAREKKIQLRVEVDPALKEPVMGDPTRLCQVINNLVHNAIKFTNTGSVWLRLQSEGREGVSQRVLFSVEDTGIGIPKEKQGLIFEEFAQADSSTSRSYGGTGLGLTISKRLLSLQGVQLNLQSEPGKGSIFSFSQAFPLVSAMSLTSGGPTAYRTGRVIPKATEFSAPMRGEPAPAAEAATEAPPAPKTTPTAAAPPETGTSERPLDGVCVLLVEDNPLNVLVTTKVLNRWGATVDHAANGKEALEKLDPFRHHLILMDMHMPVMDGYTATLRIREMGLNIPIIALTASVAKEEHKALYAYHIDEVVTKPFHPDQLLHSIRTCLAKGQD